MLIFTICHVYASKWLRRVLLFHFLVIVRIKGEESKLRTCQNMVWKAFLLFGDLYYLHNLPCICVSLGIKVEKSKLRTCQNMAWTAFLLFGDIR